MSHTQGDMRIVGFGFQEAWQAKAAEAELRSLLDLGDRDLSIAEVGGEARLVNGDAVVLAGRIREDRLAEATDLVERYGGEVLTEVRETWL